MASFFQNFPKVYYRFGNAEKAVVFNNLTVYIDLIDQLKEQVEFYQKYTILDGDRPDVVSTKLYGGAGFHWTFYLLNDSIRESGWPQTEQDIRTLTKTRYPNRTVVTEDIIADKFLPGDFVTGKSSNTTGTVIERNLDLGQIVIKTIGNNNFDQTEQIAAGTTTEEQNAATITLKSESIQYDAVHHYENADKEYVDIDPLNQDTASLTAITEMDRQLTFNNNLKNISVIKHSAINEVSNEFKRLLRQ